MDTERLGELFPKLVQGLLSNKEEDYDYVLETYFTEDAILTHPILNVKGRGNIRKVFRVWTTLNAKPPVLASKTGSMAFNGVTAVINIKQNICPRILPFLHFVLPAVITLRFREENGKLHVYKQEDNWTLDGLIRSVPLINWWYENVVRVLVGNMVTSMGTFLATANSATSQLAFNANHIHQHSGDAIIQSQNRALKYTSDIANNLTYVLNRTKNSIPGIGFRSKSLQNQNYITNGEDEYCEDSEEDS